MNVSLILPCFKRSVFLDYCFWSLTQQKINHDLEIVVCNDYLPDGTRKVCEKYQHELNIKYVFTGKRNEKEIIKRPPGFAINIGVKQCKGDIIILSLPGIYHLNDSINLIINPLKENKKIISTERNIFRDKGDVINYLSQNLYKKLPNEISSTLILNKRTEYNGTLPYFMAMYKQEFINIGGYDEDFIGIAGDDDDLVHRLKLNGLKYQFCEAKVVHIYHPEVKYRGTPKWKYNNDLRLRKMGTILRNKEKQWGIIK